MISPARTEPSTITLVRQCNPHLAKEFEAIERHFGKSIDEISLPEMIEGHLHFWKLEKSQDVHHELAHIIYGLLGAIKNYQNSMDAELLVVPIESALEHAITKGEDIEYGSADMRATFLGEAANFMQIRGAGITLMRTARVLLSDSDEAFARDFPHLTSYFIAQDFINALEAKGYGVEYGYDELGAPPSDFIIFDSSGEELVRQDSPDGELKYDARIFSKGKEVQVFKWPPEQDIKHIYQRSLAALKPISEKIRAGYLSSGISENRYRNPTSAYEIFQQTCGNYTIGQYIREALANLQALAPTAEVQGGGERSQLNRGTQGPDL